MMKLSKIAFLLLMALTVVSCGKKKQEAVVAEKRTPVAVASASKSNIQVSRVYSGTLEGWKQAQIFASIPEAVVALPVKEGSAVKAGQVLIILDQQGRASQLRQVKAVYEESQDNFEKMTRLYEQGAVSEQMYDNSKTANDIARANYESARQQVELTSPISGILTDLTVNVGQYVPLGAPLATVAQTDNLRMTIYVDDRSVANLKVGQIAKISTASAGDGNTDFEGKVTEIALSADLQTKLFRVELQVENGQGALSSGIFARASVVVKELDNVLTVPREAVFFLEGIPKVYTVTDSSRARERSIEIGEDNMESYQILSGLTEGEKVITLGRSQVSDGSLVKIVEEAGSPTGTGEISRES
jgi:RND family efflux transporter MFP subunit